MGPSLACTTRLRAVCCHPGLAGPSVKGTPTPAAANPRSAGPIARLSGLQARPNVASANGINRVLWLVIVRLLLRTLLQPRGITIQSRTGAAESDQRGAVWLRIAAPPLGT